MPWCWCLLQVNREGRGLPRWLSSKEPACNAGDTHSNPWAKNIPWRRKEQPTPVFLPGKSQRQRSLVGYPPWGCRRVRHDWEIKHERGEEKYLRENWSLHISLVPRSYTTGLTGDCYLILSLGWKSKPSVMNCLSISLAKFIQENTHWQTIQDSWESPGPQGDQPSQS